MRIGKTATLAGLAVAIATSGPQARAETEPAPVPGLTGYVYPMHFNFFSYDPSNWISKKPVPASGLRYDMRSTGALIDQRVMHPFGWRLEGRVYFDAPGIYLVRTRIEWGDFRDTGIMCRTRLSVGSPIRQAIATGIADQRGNADLATPLSFYAQIPVAVHAADYYDLTTEIGCSAKNGQYALGQMVSRAGPTIHVETRLAGQDGAAAGWTSENVYRPRSPVVASAPPSPPSPPRENAVQGWDVASWPAPMPFSEPTDDAKPLARVKSPAGEPAIGAGLDRIKGALGFASVARSYLVVPPGREGVWPMMFYVTAPKGAPQTARCAVEGLLGDELLFRTTDLGALRAGWTGDPATLTLTDRYLPTENDPLGQITLQRIAAVAEGGRENGERSPERVGRLYFHAPYLQAREYTLTINTYCGFDSPNWPSNEPAPRVLVSMRPPGHSAPAAPQNLWVTK